MHDISILELKQKFISHKTNNAIATSDVEMRLPQRYVINQRYWAKSGDISGTFNLNRVF